MTVIYYISLILSLVAIVMSFVLLLRVINADKPKQQDDHDYSDDYTDPTKILGGTCNWDEEKELAEKQGPCSCSYCTDKEFMRKMQDLVQFTDENCSMEMRYCPNCGQRLEW